MSNNTNSTIIHEWQDAPEPGQDADEWPYPTSYTKSMITGELADRIRERMGADASAPVFITETCESGGYSEYTQENDYSHTIQVGEHTIDISSGSWTSNGVTALIKWLDRTEAQS